MSLLIAFQDFLFKKTYFFVNQTKCSLLHLGIWLSREIYIYIYIYIYTYIYQCIILKGDRGEEFVCKNVHEGLYYF